ncbi:MAG TPA: glycerol-3-phosphate acyltransferase, partial [Terriglobia bacterium]|nr:glycerol-3-phosphate acyltransferase [Terriglobia bacterium]
MTALLSIALAYLLGSIPFGYLIVRWQRGIDVRQTGSRSIGATNVMRTLGPAGFLATFLLDFGKGVAAVEMARRLTSADPRTVAAAAVAAVLGHIAPVWLGFRGGKGVATGVGAFIALAPVPMGLSLLAFAVIVAVWRYVSLGSIVA